MSILQLDKTEPRYPVGSTFQLRRNAWSNEVISATVETARWTDSFGWIMTVEIAGKYKHWRVIFEYQAVKQEVKTAKAA